jgi:hypothetical protein
LGFTHGASRDQIGEDAPTVIESRNLISQLRSGKMFSPNISRIAKEKMSTVMSDRRIYAILTLLVVVTAWLIVFAALLVASP